MISDPRVDAIWCCLEEDSVEGSRKPENGVLEGKGGCVPLGARAPRELGPPPKTRVQSVQKRDPTTPNPNDDGREIPNWELCVCHTRLLGVWLIREYIRDEFLTPEVPRDRDVKTCAGGMGCCCCRCWWTAWHAEIERWMNVRNVCY
jgi:hypothetical protein